MCSLALLIAGDHDDQVLQLKHEAEVRMTTARSEQIKVVPGATHLFEEPGKMEQVAAITAEFLAQHDDAAATTEETSAAAQREEKQSLQREGDKIAELDEMKQPPEAAGAATRE